MAEERREEEIEDFRNVCVLRSRNPAEGTERAKLEGLNSSQGPLSSIRAAFKRRSSQSRAYSGRPRRYNSFTTSATNTSRWPEITILSVDPLPPTSWFAAASGGFQQRRFTSRPVWDSSLCSSDQVPPSYDQVIKEKTQEQVKVLHPTPRPRRFLTSSVATQTDSVEGNRTRPATAAANPTEISGTGDLVEKPRKPPRPSLPKPQTTAKAGGPSVDTPPPTDPHTPSHLSPSPPQSDQSTSVLVSTDFCTTPSVQGCDPSKPPSPVPCPRSKHKRGVTNEVKVQTLVRLQYSDPVTSLENASGLSSPYLLELLEAFGFEPPRDLSCSGAKQEDQNDQSEENLNENMTAFHSDRNIRSRIQAFESQVGSDEASAPSPRPRNIYTKAPVVAPKPSIAPRPSINRPAVEEAAAAEDNHYEDISILSAYPAPEPARAHVPVPAPRPLPPRKPSLRSQEESKPTPPVKPAALLPSRPTLSRSRNVCSQEEDAVFKAPPTPGKPSKELLNLNNHNSTGLLLNAAQTLKKVENEYVDFPASNGPAKPTYGGLFPAPASSEQPISTQPNSRRPTVIRVPSTISKYDQKASDFARPRPVAGAVGGAPLPTKLSHWEPFGGEPDLALTPRPSGGKTLPPRPPPAKTGPGRPPLPRRDSCQRAPLQQGTSLRSPTPMQQRQSRKPSKKGPVLPPRPNPGHRLYINYTLEIPHGIAQFDYNGTRTGELSFQKNEVLVLLNQIDSRTYECQVGDARGTVQDTYMKIITPLSNYSDYAENPVPQEKSFINAMENSSLQVQALYDFTPEGPGELDLRAGDIVSNVEQLDTEWYLGTCRGTRGFFPINYVKVLTGSSTPTAALSNERRTQQSAVSGPRCVARFDFEGEQADELSFCEGDVIQLQEYLGEEWARGKLGGHVGIFPLNFVEIVEDLPAPAEQNHTRVALPGMAGSHSVQAAPTASQADTQGVKWAVALYDFTAETEEDLPFRQGDMILVTAHIDEEWCSGRLNGREGVFPSAFVQPCAGGF